MKFIGFIPCKTNSRRLPRKNFREIDGLQLWQYALNFLEEGGIHVYISTDDIERFKVLTEGIVNKHATVFERSCKDPDAKWYPLLKDMIGYGDDRQDWDYLAIASPDTPYRSFTAQGWKMSDIMTFIRDNPCDELSCFHPLQGKTGMYMGTPAIKIVSRDAVIAGNISGYTYALLNSVADIHTPAELRTTGRKMVGVKDA